VILYLHTKTDIADRTLQLHSFPFVFGREASELQTPPYSSSEAKEQLRHISRKHATFHLEQNKLFLTDNGSLNGTVVNGERLGENPRQLVCGDRILFADRYDYVVDIDDDNSKEMVPSLQLLETSTTTSNRTIEITTLPYLTNRNGTPFYSHDFSEIPNIPDRFAKIFYHNDNVLLASLVPDSGIILDSRPMSLGAYTLNEGSVIQLPSGVTFTFSTTQPEILPSEDQTVLLNDPLPEEQTVQFREPPATAPDSSSEPAPPEEDATIYMSEATSFLNVFKESESGTTPSTQKSAPKPLPGQTQQAQYHQPDNTHTTPNKRGWLKYAIGASLVLACLFVAVFYYRSTPEFVARSLYKDSQYSLSLLKTNEILSKTQSSEFQELGRNALLMTLSTTFPGMLTEHDHSAIRQLLDEARTKSTHIQDSSNIIDAMVFIAQVDIFFTKNQNDHRITDENWKNETSAINETWQKNRPVYRPIYDEIIQVEPKFATVLQRLHKQLNDNREIEIYTVDEIEKIELTVRNLVREKKFQQLKKLIQTFNNSHPELQGSKWLSDLDRYTELLLTTETNNLFQLLATHQSPAMETPVFTDLSNKYYTEHYPDDAVFTMVLQAKEQWQSGLALESISTLSLCPPSPWEDLIQQEIKKLQQITALVEQAKTGKIQEQTCRTIEEFHKQTRDVDQYYRELLADISSKCRAISKQSYQVQIQKANSLFFSYLQNQGINGQMRLEESISESFRQRAVEISKAYHLTKAILEGSRHSNVPLSADEKKNIDVIQNEYQMQITRLQESRVLSPALVQEKLNLFNQQ